MPIKKITEITETQHNNKQKLQILEALNIRIIQPKFNWINFETSASLATDAIYRNKFEK